MEVVEHGRWIYYLGEDYEELDPDRCGKWMWEFDDVEEAAALCEEAVEYGIVCEAKHNAYIDPSYGTGICCLYLHGDDEERHEEVISFLLDNDLVPRDASGRLRDIPFKYDWQTCEGQYGDDFVPEITLGDFIDLGSGEWLE